MSFIGQKDFSLEVALDNVPGYSKINKFGSAPDCDSGVFTDIWDGADGSTSTDIWVAPTQARTHTIASTSGNDAVAGTGLQTMRVYGLKDWDSKETSEIVSVGDTTANSYVIIHRIKGLTFGSGGTNAGIITATATTDGTITAAIQAGEGQTQMAIYGIPSTQTIHLKHVRADILRGVSSVISDLHLLVKENADLSTAGFIHKEDFQFASSTPLDRIYNIPKSFTGPAIIKIQVDTNSNNCNVTASFDAYIVDN